MSNPDDEPWFPSVGPRLGSWGQTIKRAGTEAEWAWDEGDIPGYVEALAETGQNTVICDINTEQDWEEF